MSVAEPEVAGLGQLIYLPGFRFEGASGRLWQGEQEVPLRPKTAAVLAVLAAHAGMVVSKRDLMREVWPEGFVGDAALAVCVTELRRAFGDDARRPQYVATAPRRGYRLVAEVSLAPPQAATPPRLFVGRTRELEVLRRWWAAALDGSRQAGFVAGQAGVGKTALVDVFADTVRQPRDVLVGRGDCVEQFGQGEPYLPVLDALAGLCVGPGAGLVRAALDRYAPSWLLALPGLADAAETAALLARTAGAGRQRMLRELADAVDAITAARPLVLVLEDLQDADEATTGLIAYLARRRAPARLLLLGTYRPAELVARAHPLRPVLQDLRSAGRCGHLMLELWSAADTAAYLRARLAPRSPSAELVAAVHERTEGNALFAVAVTGALLAGGLLVADGGTVRAADRLDVLGIPDQVRLMLDRQVESLDEADRRMLAVAAAAGVEFTAEAVSAGLSQLAGAGLSPAEVEQRCGELARLGAVVVPAGVARWPDGTVSGRYRFAHAMYREVLYGRLAGPAQRAQVHRGIGSRLAAGYADRAAEVAGELAMHFERGGDYPAAVAHRCAAAETALGRSAYPETRRHARRALGLLERIPDPALRGPLELRARRATVVAAAASWGWRDAQDRADCARLRDLASELNDAGALATALLGLHNEAMTRGDAATMRESGSQAAALAGRTADGTAAIVSHFLRMQADSSAGLPARAWEHARAMLDGYDPVRHRPLTLLVGDQFDVAGHLYAGISLWHLGFPDRARRHADQAVRQARAREIPAGLARALWLAACVYLMCGDTDRVGRMAAELGPLCARHHLALWAAGAVVFEGWAAGARGDPAAGLAKVRAGMAGWAARARLTTFYRCLTGELCLATGEVAAGLAAVDAGLAAVARTGHAQDEPELLRLRGELLLRENPGHPGEAERSMLRALQLAAERQDRSFELRAVTSLARLWQAGGEARQARALLAGVHGLFTEGRDTRDLALARAVLDELG
jgi:DNA-binding winged helix-turn-helix (wHTH) protein/tetratricopeptide (TPR) repeat protein